MNTASPVQDHPPELPPPKPAASLPALAVIGMYLLVMALIAFSTWMLIMQDWAAQQRVQETELASLARAQDEHVAHTFGNASEALHRLAALMPPAGIPPSAVPGRLRAQATEDILRTPPLHLFAAYSASGEELLRLQQRTASGLPALPRLPSPSWAYWRQSTDSRSFIHPPLSDTQRHWYIPIEQAARNARGELIGSVFALLATQDFETFFRETQLTAQDRFALLTLNGQILLHFPAPLPGEILPDYAQILARASDAHDRVSFETTYQFGDARHIGVFRLLRDLPLIAVVSRPAGAAQASFLAMRQRLILGVSVLAIVLGVLAWLIYHTARRQDAARAGLDRLNTSLEARVSHRTAELEQSNRELIAFSYSISHDLRAPLRAINGFSHALKEDCGEQLDAQGRDYLDRIYRASVRLGKLIDELLSLANISRAPLTLSDVDLSPMAHEIVADLRHENPDREVLFEAPLTLPTQGDEALLRNALSNLLHNAWKFTRAQHPAIISLQAQDDEEFTRFTLSDNGLGFDMAHAKRLFQPFQQLHADQGFGGTGIGLASVRRIIERHGGQIWAESTPGEGARFIFTLPRRARLIRQHPR